MKKIKISLSLVSFEEDGVHFAYSPALDIMGYDITEDGARASFEEMLSFFIEHNIQNGMLHQELERLGWDLKQKDNPLPPSLRKIVEHNPYFSDLYEKQEAKQIKSMAIQAQDVELQLT